MLLELHIENFAIIDHVELQFGPGLITFTGETGAGKSILIDAVELLLGGRADTTMVRSNAERAIVEGIFELSPKVSELVQPLLEREELTDGSGTLTLGREVRVTGRSVARVNGRIVSVTFLRQLSQYLVDVHGQSEHLSLLQVKEHLHLLDNYAAVTGLRRAYREVYDQLIDIRKELKRLRQTERDAARQSDTLTYQINEIETARLQPGEDIQLQEERNRLANAEGLASLAQDVLSILDEPPPEAHAATDLLGQSVQRLRSLAKLDPTQANLAESAQLLSANLAELVRDIRIYIEGIEFNPKRLDQVEERLALIHNLKRKYGDSILAILTYAENAREELNTINNASERIQELESAESQTLQQLASVGLQLSEQRHRDAEKLSRAIEGELDELQMPEARFRVGFQLRQAEDGVPLPDGRRVAFDKNGLERIEFLIAPNPGEGFKPLAKIASGGETSRLMLALKNVLAAADRIPSLIFDEIDQGIGGRVGRIVGHKLWKLAQHHQVLCVTHLPQLAAYGMQHFHVEKKTHEGRTRTQVITLEGQHRTEELAQMLGGVSKGTLQSAREILKSASQVSIIDN